MGSCYGYAAGGSDNHAVAGDGLGLRASEAYNAQATGSAHAGCTYDALSDGNYGAECVCSSTASAAIDPAFNYDGVSG